MWERMRATQSMPSVEPPSAWMRRRSSASRSATSASSGPTTPSSSSPQPRRQRRARAAGGDGHGHRPAADDGGEQERAVRRDRRPQLHHTPAASASSNTAPLIGDVGGRGDHEPVAGRLAVDVVGRRRCASRRHRRREDGRLALGRSVAVADDQHRPAGDVEAEGGASVVALGGGVGAGARRPTRRVGGMADARRSRRSPRPAGASTR